MKQLLTPGLFGFLLFYSVNNYAQQAASTRETKITNGTGTMAKGSLNMQGAYSMLKQMVSDGTKDSLLKKEQLKIYTDRYMIYAGPQTGDSLASYGIGTYRSGNDEVTEYDFYGASNGAHNDTFTVKINKAGNGYTQIINFPEEQGRKFILTETYKSVGKRVTTPLDGAWKQTKSTYTSENGTTSTEDHPTQFKVYQSGYFIWANTSQDSTAGKSVSFYGYGTFDMKGGNTCTEVNSSSSFKTALVGKPVTLKVEFTGKDAYQQTIVFPNGSRIVEAYERMK